MCMFVCVFFYPSFRFRSHTQTFIAATALGQTKRTDVHVSFDRDSLSCLVFRYPSSWSLDNRVASSCLVPSCVGLLVDCSLCFVEALARRVQQDEGSGVG